MKAQNKLSRSRRNYYMDITSLLPCLLLLYTGIIMLVYHTGKPFSETILSKDGNFWLNIHRIFAIIIFVMVTLHLSLHLSWFKKLFSGKLKNRFWIRNLILVILFLPTSLTSAVPWLILEESETSSILLGVHNKIGLLLIVFFIIHLFSYLRWLIKMTKNEFADNPVSNKRDV